MEIQLVYIVEGYKFKEYKNADDFEEFIKNKNFKEYELRIIANAFQESLNSEDVEKIVKVGPDSSKMKLVLSGLLEDLNVEFYANKELTIEQMKAIRYGLFNNLKVEYYADPKYTIEQMKAIIYGLINNLKVEHYANPKYTAEQMMELIDGLEKGLDIKILQNEKLSVEEMKQIKNRLMKLKK